MSDLHYDDTDFGPLDPCPTCRTRTDEHDPGCSDPTHFAAKLDILADAARATGRAEVMAIAARALRTTDYDHLRSLVEAEG